jgi:glutathione synthase/RimK-type ligase-like ATP-grasp enzyme
MISDLVVLYEHPEWQLPLFAALQKRGVRYEIVDLKSASFDVDAIPEAKIYFNQASPSAYVRGNTRAVSLAYALIRSLEIRGARVLNGSQALGLELSKSAQGSLMQTLGIDHPKSLAFNDVETALAKWSTWPALIKPEQGGSGARMFLLNGPDDLRKLLADDPGLWLPDNLLLLQERFEVSPERGIIRMEFLGGKYLYAMRVVSHGGFNLCPSEVCNPVTGEGSCEIPVAKPVEFFSYHDVPAQAVATGEKIMAVGGLDVGGIEYLEAEDGRLIFYDVNANSNLRPAVAQEFGFDPFERVVDFLQAEIARA